MKPFSFLSFSLFFFSFARVPSSLLWCCSCSRLIQNKNKSRSEQRAASSVHGTQSARAKPKSRQLIRFDQVSHPVVWTDRLTYLNQPRNSLSSFSFPAVLFVSFYESTKKKKKKKKKVQVFCYIVPCHAISLNNVERNLI